MFIEAVLASGNHLFGTYFETIKDDSTGSASQQWADPSNGAVSCHSVAGRVGLPQVNTWRQLIWKTSSFVKLVAKSIQHSEAYNKVVMTTVL